VHFQPLWSCIARPKPQHVATTVQICEETLSNSRPLVVYLDTFWWQLGAAGPLTIARTPLHCKIWLSHAHSNRVNMITARDNRRNEMYDWRCIDVKKLAQCSCAAPPVYT
jgi:hypothetical protein